MAGTSQLSTEDESLLIASKSFHRVIDAASTRGYREGSVNASEHVLQKGFNDGYVDAFHVAFALGKYKSMMHNTLKGIKPPEDVRAILDKTRRGYCYICKLEQIVNSNYLMEMSFSDIRDRQREENNNVLERLHEHFNVLM